MNTNMISPGHSIGPYVLGTDLNEILNRRHSQALPAHIQMRLLHSSHKLIVDIPDLKLSLRFDPLSQRLWAIDCYDLEHFTTWHTEWQSNKNTTTTATSNNNNNAPSRTPHPTTPPTFASILRQFGPTFPSSYDIGLDIYPLKYRGVTFGFPLPPQFRSLYTPESNTMPIRLPDGSEIVATKASIHIGTDVRSPSLPSNLKVGDVHVTLALQLHRDPNGGNQQWCSDFALKMEHSKRRVRRNDPAQRVLSELGAPSNVHLPKRKQQSNVRSAFTSASGSGSGFGSGGECDYFFNYFHLGFDIMFDGNTHTVKKIVCHNNVPGCIDFGVYRRCHFRLLVQWRRSNDNKESDTATNGGGSSGGGATNGGGGNISGGGGGNKNAMEGEGAVVASSRTSWIRVKEQINKWVGDVEGPMVCGGTGGSEGLFEYGGGQSVGMGVRNGGSRFGETLLYGCCGAVFEIVDDALEKVVVFASGTGGVDK